MSRTAALGIGLVGLGRWGMRLLDRLLATQESGAHRLQSICNRTGGKRLATALERAKGVRTHDSLGAMLDDPAVDAVILATPIDTHVELATEALRRGKHVWVEKPLCRTSHEARELEHLARRNGRALFVGHTFLYHPAVRQLNAERAGRRVLQLTASWRKWGTFGSDIWFNLGCHDVAIALTLFEQPPTRVLQLHAQPGRTPCDLLTVRLEFGQGRQALLEMNRLSRQRNKSLWMVMEDHNVLSWQDNDIITVAADGCTTSRPVVGEPAVDREIRAFVEQCEAGEGLDIRAIQVVEVLEQLSDTPRGEA